VQNFLSQFFITEDSAKLESAAATMSAAFTVQAQPAGLLDAEADLEIIASTSTQDNLIFYGTSNIESAMTFTVNANFSTDVTLTESSAFSFASTPTVLRTATEDLQVNFATSAIPSRLLGSTVAITSALAFAVDARMVTQADPYFTIKVPQEIRTQVVPADSRVLLIFQENRVNTPATELRLLLVEQETRIYYLPIPPLTNINQTPYERAI
jgi:hypothetical protein